MENKTLEAGFQIPLDFFKNSYLEFTKKEDKFEWQGVFAALLIQQLYKVEVVQLLDIQPNEDTNTLNLKLLIVDKNE